MSPVLKKAVTPSPSGEPIAYLQALAERLQANGWYARVVVARKTPSLRVINPTVPPLNDDITVGPDTAGLWWFRWSFGVRIAYVGNLDIATARITQVLGCPSR